MGWSAAYSTVCELGPVSEASLGNVGKGGIGAGGVDLVITPQRDGGQIVRAAQVANAANT